MGAVDLMSIWQSDRLLLALANLILCSGLAWACLCRITVMSSSTTSKHVRAAYSVLMTVAIGVGTLPIWSGEWPGIGNLMLTGSQLVVMWAGRHAWRGAVHHPARRIGEVNAKRRRCGEARHGHAQAGANEPPARRHGEIDAHQRRASDSQTQESAR